MRSSDLKPAPSYRLPSYSRGAIKPTFLFCICIDYLNFLQIVVNAMAVEPRSGTLGDRTKARVFTNAFTLPLTFPANAKIFHYDGASTVHSAHLN
jgi:hypothetical protein